MPGVRSQMAGGMTAMSVTKRTWHRGTKLPAQAGRTARWHRRCGTHGLTAMPVG